jgi:hypothetical protein
MQRPLDPELLLGTGSPNDGRFDSPALSVDQNPLEDQAQELVTQRGGLPLPARTEIR